MLWVSCRTRPSPVAGREGGEGPPAVEKGLAYITCSPGWVVVCRVLSGAVNCSMICPNCEIIDDFPNAEWSLQWNAFSHSQQGRNGLLVEGGGFRPQMEVDGPLRTLALRGDYRRFVAGVFFGAAHSYLLPAGL